MEVTFIRHGEAEHNVAFCERGEAVYFDPDLRNSGLTERGIDQSIKRSMDIDISEFQVVLTSPLPRCLQTTSIIFRDSDAGIFVIESLRENDLTHICNLRPTKTWIASAYPSFDVSNLETEEDPFDAPDLLAGNDEIVANWMQNLDEILEDFFEAGITKIAVVSHNDRIKSQLALGYSVQNGGRVDVVLDF